MTRIIHGKETAIRPEFVHPDRPFFRTFENRGADVTARYLVNFAQKRGHWLPFSKKEIDTFVGSDCSIDMLKEFIQPENENVDPITFCYTVEFVTKCFHASPMEYLLNGLVEHRYECAH